MQDIVVTHQIFLETADLLRTGGRVLLPAGERFGKDELEAASTLAPPWCSCRTVSTIGFWRRPPSFLSWRRRSKATTILMSRLAPGAASGSASCPTS